MDAPRPPGGAPAPRAPQSPAPEPQRKSRQHSSLFSFFRRASREEFEEQAVAKNRQNGSMKKTFFAKNDVIKETFLPKRID
jgi:hypothetical protein